jgi:hypothetical protein
MFNPNDFEASRIRHAEMRQDTRPQPEAEEKIPAHRAAVAKVGSAMVTIGTRLEEAARMPESMKTSST